MKPQTLKKDIDTHASGQAKLAAAGAVPSNTAPPSCNSNQINPPIKVLRFGLDSLYLSFPGRLYPETEQILLEKQSLARSRSVAEEALAYVPVGEYLFEVSAKTGGIYKFVLQNDAYRIQLSSTDTSQLPLAYVQVKSSWLTLKGPSDVLADLTELIRNFGEISGEEGISRADQYVDFVCTETLESLSHSAFVSRAELVQSFSLGRKGSGYTVGQGGVLSARLYDKTIELEKSKKDYLKPIWIEAGWNPGETVWRLEFQWRREPLVEHKIGNLLSLLERLGPLWRYATTQWLKLTIPSTTDSTQTRWPMHPVWAALSSIDWPESLPGVSVPVRSTRSPDRKYLFVNGLAPLTSFMAIRNIDDPELAFTEFFAEAKEYHDSRIEVEGIDFAGYCREKAALKARKYNLPFDGNRHPGHPKHDNTKAVQYRKATRGE